MKICYVLKVLFFFVRFYSSFVLVYKGVYVVLSHISCCLAERENGICAIWKTPVEVRRNGVGAFLVQLFGHKKVYKVENQLLVDYSQRRGRDWLLRSLRSLRLTPFPTARRRGPCKPILGKKVINHLICFPHLCPQASLCPRYKKQKVSIARHPLASWSCGERGIRTPGTVARSPHFECGPIDHSGTSPIPRCKYKNFFVMLYILYIFFYLFAPLIVYNVR